MATSVIDRLIKYFPIERNIHLSYDEFISDDISTLNVEQVYEDEPWLARPSYNLIARPWPEICWPEVAGLGLGLGLAGTSIVSFMNEKTFIHSFPSLLNFIHVFPSLPKDENTGPASLLMDSFIECSLNLRNLYQDWKLAFYFSFNDDLIKIVHDILKEINEPIAEDAIESYWH
ncbi:MAG: hypothetical protein LBF61_13285 [Azoarcus sp.]|jgi:hypothetical protein|nr:hypothetical protein [Azoarcus sp.]